MSKSSIQDSRTDILIPEFCHCARLLYASACTEYQNSNIPSYMYEAICFHVVLCRTKKMRKLSKSPNDSADSCGLDRIFIIIGTGQCVYPKSIRRDAALRIHSSTTLSRHTHSDPDQIIWLLLEMFEKTAVMRVYFHSFKSAYWTSSNMKAAKYCRPSRIGARTITIVIPFFSSLSEDLTGAQILKACARY